SDLFHDGHVSHLPGSDAVTVFKLFRSVSHSSRPALLWGRCTANGGTPRKQIKALRRGCFPHVRSEVESVDSQSRPPFSLQRFPTSTRAPCDSLRSPVQDCVSTPTKRAKFNNL